MKIVTEFLVLHEDGEMPNEEKLCPSIWQDESMDSEGDYYYDSIDGRWTHLTVSRVLTNGKKSILEVNTYREKNRNYDPGICEVDDLKRYIQYRNEGRYDSNSNINGIKDLCITSLSFETYDLEGYEEFLKTVYYFLNYTAGIIVNHKEMDAASFKSEYF
jgi:hypothetical protein